MLTAIERGSIKRRDAFWSLGRRFERFEACVTVHHIDIISDTG
jgi:hypothetical protein